MRPVRPCETPGGVRIHQGSFDFQAATALSEEESQSLQAANVGSARIFAVGGKKQTEVQNCLRNRRYLERLGSGDQTSVIKTCGYRISVISTVIISCP